MLTFFALWIVFGLFFQIITLPFAAVLGLRRQLHIASVGGALFSAGILLYESMS